MLIVVIVIAVFVVLTIAAGVIIAGFAMAVKPCTLEESRAWQEERYPHASLFGIHGESLGAATSIAVLEEKPPVDFVVADCGFSEIVPVLKSKAAAMHAPGFLIGLASVCAGIRFGYSFSRMRPIDSLRENTVPVLFIHGADDHVIPPEHSKRMKEATKGYAEMHLVPGADHAMSVLTDPKAYLEYIASFLADQFPGR